jgi:histidinol-phosphate phosphatase family protein
MAGGKGTRLFSVTNDEIPKAMVRLVGKPVLEYQIEVLRKNNISQIYISIGHLGEKIKEYFKNGKDFGVKIEYINEDKPLGTAGALYYLKNIIKDNFILLFGDLIFDININLMYQYHKEKNAYATVFTHPNSHPYDSDIVLIDEDCKILSINFKSSKRNYDYYNNHVKSSIYIFRPEMLEYITERKEVDLEKDLLLKIIEKTGRAYAYFSSEYVKDIGTPKRLEKAEFHMKNGFITKKNLLFPQKCIFLDRDGTLNKLNGLIYSPEQFKMEKYVVEAIRAINDSEYLAIVITNQSTVARGLCSIKTLDEIHKKLQTLLGNNHVYVDDIFFCPHHPDKGYSDENSLYKTDCECRKPKIGMLKRAAEKYNIDLSNSWIIGDTTSDIMTGKNAGTRTILVKTGESGKDGKYEIEPDFTAENLFEAIKYIKETSK